jgi:hypothetical protein
LLEHPMPGCNPFVGLDRFAHDLHPISPGCGLLYFKSV